MYVCMCVCMYVCMYVYMYICMYVHNGFTIEIHGFMHSLHAFLPRPAFCHVLHIMNAIAMEVTDWEDSR